MIKRRFLHLDEISDKTPYTKGDIFELIENGDLSFCASVCERHMGAGKIYRAKKRTILWSVFSYEGVVRLSGEDSRALLRSNNPQQVRRVQILEPKKIEHWGEPEFHFGKIEQSMVTIIREIPIFDTPFSSIF